MMRAARLSAAGKIETIDTVPPVAGDGQVMVAVGASSICGSDLNAFLGQHPRIKAPTILGHEFSGVVEEIGPGASSDLLGARVAVDPMLGCRTCRYCRSGHENLCLDYAVLGEDEGHPGSFAGRVAVAADHVHRIPDHLSFEEGALVQPLAIGLHAVRDRGEVERDQVVLVVGAGAIGQAIAMWSAAAGARVLVTDPLRHRLQLAERLSGSIGVVADASADERVRELTGGYGVDIAFEAVGGAGEGPLSMAIRSTARGGQVIVVGSYAAPTVPVPVGLVKYRELTMRGSQGHPRTFPTVIEALASGRISARPLVSHRIQITDVARAFDLLRLRRQDVVKVIVEPAISQ